MRLAPPADTWSEVAVELRCCREEWCCAQRFDDCFFFDVVGKVVDTLSSCQACVTVVQKNASNCSCRGKRMIHSAIVRAWEGIVRVALEHRGCFFHYRSCHAAIKKQDLDLIVVRDPPRAHHDAQGSCVGVRRNRTHVRSCVGEGSYQC